MHDIIRSEMIPFSLLHCSIVLYPHEWKCTCEMVLVKSMWTREKRENSLLLHDFLRREEFKGTIVYPADLVDLGVQWCRWSHFCLNKRACVVWLMIFFSVIYWKYFSSCEHFFMCTFMLLNFEASPGHKSNLFGEWRIDLKPKEWASFQTHQVAFNHPKFYFFL